MGIKVNVNKVQLPTGQFVAFFASEISEGVDVANLPVVCLSRVKPGKCMFRVDVLHEHDHHSPPFSDEAGVDAYIKRVTDDIAAGLQALEAISEVDVMNTKLVPPGGGGVIGLN